jgi:hypothetical protein
LIDRREHLAFTNDAFSKLFPEARITVTMRANLRHIFLEKPVVEEVSKERQ